MKSQSNIESKYNTNFALWLSFILLFNKSFILEQKSEKLWMALKVKSSTLFNFLPNIILLFVSLNNWFWLSPENDDINDWNTVRKNYKKLINKYYDLYINKMVF